MEGFVRFLLGGADLPEGSQELTFGYEGMNPGWAFLLVLALGAAAFWAYRWGAGELPRGRRLLLFVLRLLLIALFFFLLVKPVALLTINEPVREKLLVLVDVSQSMEIADRRVSEDDLKRAAIAMGELDPARGLQQSAPAASDKLRDNTRRDILSALAANSRLNLWPKLHDKADLLVYTVGREARQIGPLGTTADDSAGSDLPLEESQALFKRLEYKDNLSALGEGLRRVLDEYRGQSLAGVFLITDGASNSGIPPEEIAGLARNDGVPVYLYGVGITAPQDVIVREITGPRGAFVKERVEFAAKIRGQRLAGQRTKLQLKANGKVVDEQEVHFKTDGEISVTLGYTPEEKGDVVIEAHAPPLPDEVVKDNNTASTRLRVLDNKIKVLYVEQEPRWDFRFLLDALEKDRRVTVKCALLDGDPNIHEENKSFLPSLPEDRKDWIENEIIIIGDVDPERLGSTRMKLINEFVSDIGGGVIFLAGMKNNPFRYNNTPLEPLLPVELETSLTEADWSQRTREPVHLKLTPAGELSSLLRLSEEPAKNRAIWNDFPGVRWTARVARARPSAQTFLVDPRPERASRDGPMPVIAQHPYGQGQVLYFGFDETYRWRSGVGQKYYIAIWGQVIQSFSLERQLGASSRTQLKTDRPEYYVGDKVIISGKLYTENFAVLEQDVVPGTLTRLPDPKEPGAQPEKIDLKLIAKPNQPGEYQAEYTALKPGQYSYSTLADAKASVKFEVLEPRFEQAETAMNEDLLQGMAKTSGGRFFREETLHELPAIVEAQSTTIPTFRKIELYFSPWWLVLLFFLASLEWLLRRLWQLK
jgi:hypothetical protein